MYNILSNEAYAGTLLWGVEGKHHREYELSPVRVENAFPALVDGDTFRQVQAMLKSRAPRSHHPEKQPARTSSAAF